MVSPESIVSQGLAGLIDHPPRLACARIDFIRFDCQGNLYHSYIRAASRHAHPSYTCRKKELDSLPVEVTENRNEDIGIGIDDPYRPGTAARYDIPEEGLGPAAVCLSCNIPVIACLHKVIPDDLVVASVRAPLPSGLPFASKPPDISISTVIEFAVASCIPLYV